MSTGRPMAWGWHGDDDVYAAIDVLKSTPGVDPSRVGVVGLSMGGEEALGAAAFDQRIRAVVAEGATGRSPADLGWLATAYGWRGQMTLAVHSAERAGRPHQRCLTADLSRASGLGDVTAARPAGCRRRGRG
jgi:uncharacterized protein